MHTQHTIHGSKRLLALLLALTAAVLLLGAMSAPVLQSKGLYMNDYASVISRQHRADILDLSTDLFANTGVQVVVLTVDSMGGEALEDYGRAVIEGWKIGGADGAQGVLILVAKEEKESGVFIGEGLTGLSEFQGVGLESDGMNLSKAIMNIYRPMLREIYRETGYTPPDELLERLDAPDTGGGLTTGTGIFLVLAFIVVARSYRNSRRYRDRYLRGNVRKPKTFSRSYDEEAQYKDKAEAEDVYEIKHDDMD